MSFKSHAWQHQRQPNFATIGNHHPAPTRRTGYELRDAAGQVLASCDVAGPLLRHLDQKRGCVVVRIKSGEVVAESPKAVADEAGLESVG